MAGDAYCWGSDSDGAQGNDAGGNQTTPGIVARGFTYKELDAGQEYNTSYYGKTVCGIRSNNKLVCWGDDQDGGVGNSHDAYSDKQDPVHVKSLPVALEFVHVSVGGYNLWVDLRRETVAAKVILCSW